MLFKKVNVEFNIKVILP